MSSNTERKHVAEEVLRSWASHLHAVEDPSENIFLVNMVANLRSTAWIKRGDYVIVEPIEEGVKVTGEVQRILHTEKIEYMKEKGMWPTAFDDRNGEDDPGNDSPQDRQHYSDVFVNTNPTTVPYEECDYAYEEDDRSTQSDCSSTDCERDV